MVKGYMLRLWGVLLTGAAIVFLVAFVLAAVATPGDDRLGWAPWLLGALATCAGGFISMLISLHSTKHLTAEEKRSWHRLVRWTGILLPGFYFISIAQRVGRQSRLEGE